MKTIKATLFRDTLKSRSLNAMSQTKHATQKEETWSGSITNTHARADGKAAPRRDATEGLVPTERGAVSGSQQPASVLGTPTALEGPYPTLWRAVPKTLKSI